MFDSEESDYEKWEYEESLFNAKSYKIPNVGDVVKVNFDTEIYFKNKVFTVIRTDYASNYVEGEEILLKDKVIITLWNHHNKSIKNLDWVHADSIIEIIPMDKSDKYSDWFNYKSKMIESQIPKVGKTAILKSRLSHIDKKLGIKNCTKFKIVEIIERGIDPLLVLRPTKHYNRQTLILSLGHVYLS